MEINASSAVGSAASTEQLVRQANEETNNEKPSAAQDKSPSAPSSVEVNISATGSALSTRAEASEESDVQNAPQQGQEATRSAEATRLQSSSEEASETSPEQRAEDLNTAIQQNPGSALDAQANASRSEVESLIAA